ncbi:uncharacterized protein METZ01_LOCUS264393, partial [marine metagenome]
ASTSGPACLAICQKTFAPVQTCLPAFKNWWIQAITAPKLGADFSITQNRADSKIERQIATRVSFKFSKCFIPR